MEATDKPDIYSHRWYQDQLTGFKHLLLSLSADYVAQFNRGEIMSEQIVKLRSEANERDARIGELLSRVESAEARLEKASKVVAELKTKGNGK